MFYEELLVKFSTIVREKKLLDKEITIKTRLLKPVEAIGKPDRDDYPLLKGKEVLMEATFDQVKGQAYTDAPSEFSGLLRKIIDLKLTDSRRRALFIAALNAVIRYLCPDLATIHCKNNEPEECSEKIVEFIKPLMPGHVGLIGLQPAILEALAKCWGPEQILCVDRDEKNRKMLKSGVTIGWGDYQGIENMFKQSDVVLATGSTAVSGSIQEILDLAKKYKRSLFFYGTTIAGPAHLMNLKRLCFKST